MGLLSKVGEGIGSLGGMAVSIAGDIAKSGVNFFSKMLLAGDEDKDPAGIVSGVNNAFAGATDTAAGFVKNGAESAGKTIGQAGDTMLMSLASPKTPAVPGFEDKSKGVA